MAAPASTSTTARSTSRRIRSAATRSTATGPRTAPAGGRRSASISGIRRAGLTLNDDQDADAPGPNTNQNFPLIASAISGGGDTTIEGSFNSPPSTTFTIDFYSNSACLGRPQGFIQGRTYLGSAQVTTDGSAATRRSTSFSTRHDRTRRRRHGHGHLPDGNTSEFSQRIVVSSIPGRRRAAGGSVVSPHRVQLPSRRDRDLRSGARRRTSWSPTTTRSAARRRPCRGHSQ